MAEEQAHGTPLIDPHLIKDALKPTPVEVAATDNIPRGRKQPTANELKPGQYCWGTGRRKKSIARVRLRPGSGKITVNRRSMEEYFPVEKTRGDVRAPLQVTKSENRYDVFIQVRGGGLNGQAGAVKLGLSRALMAADPDTYITLKNSGFLTRDGRMKERKKYGQRGARRRFQFSKR